MTKPPKWLTDGLANIWLPYTQMKTMAEPLPVKSALGTRIILEDGRALIDGIASWWSVCHGYQHPHIVKKMREQLETLSHVMFAGLAHEQAYRLANRLIKIAPTGLSRVFFSDSGSTAVEVAMKMAVQYWYNKGEKKKSKFICFRNSYHGDTMGGMSLSEPDGMHRTFKGYMPEQYILDLPNDEYSLAEFKELMDSGIGDTAAALIIEPLVQAAGGMKFHSPDLLAEIYKLAKKNNILFIADEVATGFGRTGLMFACNEAGITPDIMCLGKGLTGGMVGLAATLSTDEIYNAFLGDELWKALMHGPTFMANPLACAAANASLDLFEKEPRLKQVEKIESQLIDELEKCRELSNVADVRIKGAIGVVQIKNSSRELILELRKKFIAEGIWLRPFDDVVYIMPAFTISEKDLKKTTDAVYKVLSHG